jgi:hypothetical protein
MQTSLAAKKSCLQVPPSRHPEPGFRWARSASLWVHLTRDDHASKTMFHARALKALVLGNYSSAGTADVFIVDLRMVK